MGGARSDRGPGLRLAPVLRHLVTPVPSRVALMYLHERRGSGLAADSLFDIVQHLGLLYHLRDPLLSLSQARSVLRQGGHLLIETAVVAEETASYMLFNGVPPDTARIYEDVTTWWAPTIRCLREMLRASLFAPLDETLHLTPRYEQGD